MIIDIIMNNITIIKTYQKLDASVDALLKRRKKNETKIEYEQHDTSYNNTNDPQDVF